MRKKILSVLICGLLIGTIFVIAPSDLKIKSVSADIIEDNSKLDYSTIYEITEKLSFVINDPNVYEEDELERGRAFGSEGELETAFNILEPVLNGILGEENVECEQLESYSELSSNLEVNSLGITIKDIDAQTEEGIDCYISPRWNNSARISGYNKNILTHHFSYEDEWLDIRSTLYYGIYYYVNQMFDSLFENFDDYLNFLIENNTITEELVCDFLEQQLEYEYGFSFEDIEENPENVTDLPWYDGRIFDNDFVYIEEDRSFHPDYIRFPALKKIKPISPLIWITKWAVSKLQMFTWNATNQRKLPDGPQCRGLIKFDYQDDAVNMEKNIGYALPVLYINGEDGGNIYKDRSNYQIKFNIDQEWKEDIVSYNVIGDLDTPAQATN